MDSTRVNKYVSDTGMCSRREADKLIEQGRVTINGKVAEQGSKVYPGNEVRVDGERITRNVEPIIIAYNKPVGIVSTTDTKDPNNITHAINHPERIFPIGRLDKDSQGLILLTNEGDIVNKILRAGNEHEKEYIVTVDKAITADFIARMEKGVPILGVMTRKCKVVKKDRYVFNITLTQGLNRQIRRMCSFLGYKVERLERIRIMHIKLGNLKPGRWRSLTPDEVEELYRKIEASVKTEDASKSKKPTRKPQKPSIPSHVKIKGKGTTTKTDGKSRTVSKTTSPKIGSSKAVGKGKAATSRTSSSAGRGRVSASKTGSNTSKKRPTTFGAKPATRKSGGKSTPTRSRKTSSGKPKVATRGSQRRG